MSSSLENRKIPAGDPAGSAWREAPVAVLPTRRRLRNVFNGRTIVDTTNALVLFEHDHLPVYYVPVADIDAEALVPSDKASHCPRKGDASYWSIVVGDRTATDAVWGYETNVVDGAPDLSGYRAFYWNAVDHWYEEDEEVFVHARDPFKRIDALRSSRHVRVEIDGVVLADTHRPTLLFETGIRHALLHPARGSRARLLRPARRRPPAPTRAPPLTTRRSSATAWWMTSRGRTRTRSPRFRRSSSWSRSSTSTSTPTSTASCSPCRRAPGRDHAHGLRDRTRLMVARPLHFNAFIWPNGYHESAWRVVDDDVRGVLGLPYYAEIGSIAERGLMDSIFLADDIAIPEYRVTHLPQTLFDPIAVLSALAALTDHIGLIGTGSTTYSKPWTSRAASRRSTTSAAAARAGTS